MVRRGVEGRSGGGNNGIIVSNESGRLCYARLFSAIKRPHQRNRITRGVGNPKPYGRRGGGLANKFAAR